MDVTAPVAAMSFGVGSFGGPGAINPLAGTSIVNAGVVTIGPAVAVVDPAVNVAL